MTKLFKSLFALVISQDLVVAAHTDQRRQLRRGPQDPDIAESYKFWEHLLQSIDSLPSPTAFPVTAPTAAPDTQAPLALTLAPVVAPTATPVTQTDAPVASSDIPVKPINTPVTLTDAPTIPAADPTEAPISEPTDVPVLESSPPEVAPTMLPSAVGTTALSISMAPTTIGLQLCAGNVPVTVALGPRSNPAGVFVNVPTEQSLLNVVDCLDPNEGEVHTQASHVWWEPGPLELIFSFDDMYDLRSILFWNYFGEDFDVDQIDFEFFNANNASVFTLTAEPRLGKNENGVNTNPIMAETIPLSETVSASQVSALLSATNNRLDFQNFVFLSD